VNRIGLEIGLTYHFLLVLQTGGLAQDMIVLSYLISLSCAPNGPYVLIKRVMCSYY